MKDETYYILKKCLMQIKPVFHSYMENLGTGVNALEPLLLLDLLRAHADPAYVEYVGRGNRFTPGDAEFTEADRKQWLAILQAMQEKLEEEDNIGTPGALISHLEVDLFFTALSNILEVYQAVPHHLDENNLF